MGEWDMSVARVLSSKVGRSSWVILVMVSAHCENELLTQFLAPKQSDKPQA